MAITAGKGNFRQAAKAAAGRGKTGVDHQVLPTVTVLETMRADSMAAGMSVRQACSRGGSGRPPR